MELPSWMASPISLFLCQSVFLWVFWRDLLTNHHGYFSGTALAITNRQINTQSLSIRRKFLFLFTSKPLIIILLFFLRLNVRGMLTWYILGTVRPWKARAGSFEFPTGGETPRLKRKYFFICGLWLFLWLVVFFSFQRVENISKNENRFFIKVLFSSSRTTNIRV